jgi:hypothetical protein
MLHQSSLLQRLMHQSSQAQQLSLRLLEVQQQQQHQQQLLSSQQPGQCWARTAATAQAPH